MRVAVVGCGAMGAAAGWRLAERGADVVCYDRFSPPHDKGSSHGETRITRTAYAEGPWYVPLLQETFPMWRALERSTGSQLLTITGLLTIGEPGSKWVAGVLASAREHGLETSVLDAAETRQRYPGHVVDDRDIAVLDPQAGLLRPEAAIEAMTHGLDVHRNVVVSRVESRDGGVEVVAAQSSDRFDAAVIAAGPWIRELVPWLPVVLRRQVQVWLAIQSGVDWFAPERFPVWMRDSAADGDVYGFPTLDGRSLKLARHHGEDDATEGDTLPRKVTDADLDPLRLFVTKHMRGVTRHVMRAVECTYTNTPDQHFAIGAHPDNPRIVVVSACSGHGFKFAPVIGDIAADLVLDGGTRRDISHFSLTRFAKPV
jgi:sarcosine oxidase